jgi:hypothetical protein
MGHHSAFVLCSVNNAAWIASQAASILQHGTTLLSCITAPCPTSESESIHGLLNDRMNEWNDFEQD